MMRRCMRMMAAGIAAVALWAGGVRGQAMDQAMPAMGPRPAAASPVMGDPHAGLDLGRTPGSDTMAVLREQERAMRARYAAQNREAFDAAVRLDDFRRLAIQHHDQIKIMDSWARQSLRAIRNRQSLDGRDALSVVLDMTMRREAWMDRAIIYIQAVPIREDLAFFTSGPEEAQRIRETGLASPDFLMRDDVQAHLRQLSGDTRRMDAVAKAQNALMTFLSLGDTLTFLPPPQASRGTPWLNPAALVAAERNRPASGEAGGGAADGGTGEALSYTAQERLRINLAFNKLLRGWQENEADLAAQGLAEFVALAQAIDPEVYPSALKRGVELVYNRTFSGTLVAFVYFIAAALFFMAAVGITQRLENTALIIYAVALLCHVAAMAVRWWIGGRIPIQNQFESVMGSACLGCVVGLGLELWKRIGIFGTAFSFVGFIAATSLLAAPYVFGRDLGSAPGKTAGILSNTIWLHIHVNIVIASYALIFASFVIAVIYLITRQWHWVNPIEPAGGESPETPGGRSEQEHGEDPTRGVAAVATMPRAREAALVLAQRRTLLETLDQANMVVVQMAFWLLGIGILCGAVWADKSWGRPWGWDPKETFALVTWIVYLVIVHVRLVTRQKADTTAWLSIAGCGVMLFNWIGVNYFLAGLHSYA